MKQKLILTFDDHGQLVSMCGYGKVREVRTGFCELAEFIDSLEEY